MQLLVHISEITPKIYHFFNDYKMEMFI